MTPTASNVLFGWWSHDIGGNHNGGYSGYEPKVHKYKPGPYPGDEDPANKTGSEMLLRWIQFGVFSPILRTHCEPTCDRYVWDFPAHFQYMRAALRLRDALVPYIYGTAAGGAVSGISLLRPMYYEHPEHDEAYAHPGQYMFGDNILAAPVAVPSDNTTDGKAGKVVWLPPIKGGWRTWAGPPAPPPGTFHGRFAPFDIPVFVRDGAVLPMRTMNSTHVPFVDPLVWATWLGDLHNGTGALYEDAGDGLPAAVLVSGAVGGRSARTEAAWAAKSHFANGSRSSLAFAIGPTVGSHAGQQHSRTHVVQLRGGGGPPRAVAVNGLPARRLPGPAAGPPACAQGALPCWYVAKGSADGRDALTQPAGAVVVVTGSVPIASKTVVTVRW